MEMHVLWKCMEKTNHKTALWQTMETIAIPQNNHVVKLGENEMTYRTNRPIWFKKANPGCASFVAGKAKRGQRKAKEIKRFQARIDSWINPQSERFKDQKSEGGAKCPGSWQ